MKRTGKYLNTWFLAGETQNTLKIQGVPDSKLLVTLRDQFGDRMGAEGGKTKYVEMGGKAVTDGLLKSVHFRGQKGCVFAMLAVRRTAD